MTQALHADRARRYPGVRSFDDDEIHRHLFRGRDNDKYDLLQLVLAERVVVLFARSGIGKSSLINAGLMQPLRDRGFFPAVVRVSSVADDPLDSFYRGVKAACDRGVEKQELEEYEPADSSNWNKTSLWHFFKTFDFWGRADQLLQPVVIVDQFEELFTVVSEERRARFIDELANLIRGTRPGRSSAQAGREDAEVDDAPPYVKVVLVIREDFMAHLEELAERIPTILKARYRLGPLDVDQAKRAIIEPAQLDRPELATAPFTWSADALQCTLDFLRRRVTGHSQSETGNEVEPFQLQLVCQFVEDLVATEKLTSVDVNDLGGEQALHGILTRFYGDSIRKLCAKFGGFMLKRRLENFCEYGLITDRGRRLLREESDIERSNRISPEILTEMVQLRLLRKEPRIGDHYYELTHDTLIAPVLASRQKRQRERRQRLAAGALLVVAAIVASFFAMDRRVADAQRLANQAEENYQKAESVLNSAVERQKKARAEELLEQARNWAAIGSNPLAMHFYEAAARDGEEVDLRAERVRQLVRSASMLAAKYDLQGAIEAYRSAMDTAEGATELRDEIQREHIRMGDLLAQAGHVKEALGLYEAALAQYEGEPMSAESWNRLCWAGGIYEHADDVLAACQRAVEIRPSDGLIRDARGLVLATVRNRNLELAKDDFREYVDWASTEGNKRLDEEIQQRVRWIDALEQGRNPFDEQTMESLRKEDESSRQFAEYRLQRESWPEALGSLRLLLNAWSFEPDVQQRVQRPTDPLCENKDPEQIKHCDGLWHDDRLDGMEGITNNECSTTLTALVELNRDLGAPSEVFVTDASGYNLCVSGKTTDYYQADEQWWIAAKNNKERTDSPIDYDESTGNALSYDVAVAVRDERSQSIVGVMKAVFDAKSLSSTIQ